MNGKSESAGVGSIRSDGSDPARDVDVPDLLTRLRAAYEDFYRRSGDEVYQFRAGLKERLELEQILRDYPVLSSAESLQVIRDLERLDLRSEPKESVRIFGRICLERRLEQESADEIVRLEEAQAREAETVDDQRQSFFAATLAAAATGEREKRNRIALAHAVMCRRLLGSLLEKWQAQEAASRAIGFSSYLEAAARLRDVDPRAMVASLRQALDPRYERFREQLDAWLDRTGNPAPRGGIAIHDLWHLWNADLGADAFSSDRLMPAFRATLAGMGLEEELDRPGGRIVLDLESRPGKNPRAFCVPVEIPDRVFLVIQPAGGSRDFAQLFHESGHALHFSLTDPELPIEAKDGMGYSLTESYAFIFEHLVHDPLWLEEHAPEVDREACGRLAELRIEYIVRRLTAELEGQIASERRPEERPAAVAGAFRERIGLGVDPSAASFYLDDGLYACEYARGFAFAASLREDLRIRFGRRFWKSRATGDFLRELWWTGNRYDTASMSRRLWHEELSFDAFAAELG
jgi:hypothetical protein